MEEKGVRRCEQARDDSQLPSFLLACEPKIAPKPSLTSVHVNDEDLQLYTPFTFRPPRWRRILVRALQVGRARCIACSVSVADLVPLGDFHPPGGCVLE